MYAVLRSMEFSGILQETSIYIASLSSAQVILLYSSIH